MEGTPPRPPTCREVICKLTGNKWCAILNSASCLPPVRCHEADTKSCKGGSLLGPATAEGVGEGVPEGAERKRRRDDIEDIAPPPSKEFPEITAAHRKRLATETGLFVVGDDANLVHSVCSVVEEVLQQIPEGHSVATVKAAVTSSGEIAKIRKGTGIYGTEPGIFVVSQASNSVHLLPLTGCCGLLLNRCCRYRECKASEIRQFLSAVHDGTAPKASRGRPRPPGDMVSAFPNLVWAVQCSFRELVHDAVRCDVLVVLWHDECKSCGETLATLDALFGKVEGAFHAAGPFSDSAGGTASPPPQLRRPPLYCVCCNIYDNDLDEADWSKAGGQVPELRLYQAQAEDSTATQPPQTRRPFVKFSGLRTEAELVQFLQRESRSESSQVVLQRLASEASEEARTA